MLVEQVPLARGVEELDDGEGRGLGARAVLGQARRLLELEEGVDGGLGVDLELLFFWFGFFRRVVVL